jgi:hypothetical protein
MFAQDPESISNGAIARIQPVKFISGQNHLLISLHFGDPQLAIREHRGLCQVAVHLIQAVEDESFTTSEIMEAVRGVN